MSIARDIADAGHLVLARVRVDTSSPYFLDGFNISSTVNYSSGKWTFSFVNDASTTNYSVVALNSGYNCNESTSDRSNSGFAVESWYASSTSGSKALVGGTISIIVIE